MSEIEMPARDSMKTNGDMARVILADEEAIRAKNADLRALREYRARLLKGEASD